MTILNSLVAVIPVFVFLIALFSLDSFRLVKFSSVAGMIAVGSVIALLSLIINSAIVTYFSVDFIGYTKYGSPIVEELLKAVAIIFLVRTGKANFLVDCALYGFAIGAGFAVAENLFYVVTDENSNIFLWVVRGFGTACMHAAASFMVGVISATMIQKKQHSLSLIMLVAVGSAIVLHSLFNQFFVSPIMMTIGITALLPTAVFVVYKIGEGLVKEWLEVGLDSEVRILKDLMANDLGHTKIGVYLNLVRVKFPGGIVGDMFCFLRIHLELSIRAKGILIMRGAGLKVRPDNEVRAKLEELKFLESSIGKVGMLSLNPLLSLNRRRLSQLLLQD